MIFTNTLFHTFIPGSFPPQPMRTCVYVFFCVCVCVRHSGCHASPPDRKATRGRSTGRPEKKTDTKRWTPSLKNTHTFKQTHTFKCLPLRLSRKGGVTLSGMKGSRYLVISYFRAPRLPLRSRATGERETEKEKRERERERGPRPITSPVRVTGDRGRGGDGGKKREREKEKDTHICRLTFPPPSRFRLPPPFSDSPFDS